MSPHYKGCFLGYHTLLHMCRLHLPPSDQAPPELGLDTSLLHRVPGWEWLIVEMMLPGAQDLKTDLVGSQWGASSR